MIHMVNAALRDSDGRAADGVCGCRYVDPPQTPQHLLGQCAGPEPSQRRRLPPARTLVATGSPGSTGGAGGICGDIAWVAWRALASCAWPPPSVLRPLTSSARGRKSNVLGHQTARRSGARQ